MSDDPSRFLPVPEDLLTLAGDLVRIPSPSGEEGEVMAFAEGWLRAAGLEVRGLPSRNGRPNLIASTPHVDGPLYVMNGHLDTVPVPEGEAWEHPPFGGVVDAGRLYGRGALDMKGSCAAMMWAAARIASGAHDLKGRVQVHLVCDEETGGAHGAGTIAEAIGRGDLPRPDGIISGELSGMRLRTAERGVLQFRIRFGGRSAHTAHCRVEGLNAVAVAARGVLALEHHIDRFHPQVGYPVLSINGIAGGSAHNQVPASCTVTVDRRLVPGETREGVLEEIRRVLDALPEETAEGQHLPVRYTILDAEEDLLPYTGASMTDPSDPLVSALAVAAEAVMGHPPEPFTDWAGATDARWFRAMGIPMAILGPSGAGAHAADEYVDTEALATVGEIYRRTLLRLLAD